MTGLRSSWRAARRTPVWLATAALVIGCKSSDATAVGFIIKCALSPGCPPTSQGPQIGITGITGPIAVGDTLRLTAKLYDSSGVILPGRTFRWESRDAAKATVNTTGLVTAVGVGDVFIAATAMPDGIGAEVRLTVVSRLAPVVAVQVTLPKSFLMPGQTTAAVAVLRDASGYVPKGRLVAWSTGNATVATVAANGIVTAQAPGSTTIRATSEGVTGEAPVTVTLVAPELSLRLEGSLPEQGLAIPYSVTGQSLGGLVRGQFAFRLSTVYPWIRDEVGPLTCLREVDGMIVAAMYPSGRAGASYAEYVVVKDPRGSPTVWANGLGGGDPSLISANYCDPKFLSAMLKSMPASQFKPGVTLLEFP